MKITIVHNNVTFAQNSSQEDLLADQDSLITVQEIKKTLRTLNHEVDLFEINEDNYKDLQNLKPDIFFNQAFGIGNISDSESEVAKLLEKTKIPFTGSDFRAIELSNSKLETKKLLGISNILMPKTVSTQSGEGKKIDELHFPAIVKLSAYHCSIGMTQKSVVNSPEEVSARLSEMSKTYKGPFIVEEYIDGRELNVCLLGNFENLRVLPISEILFGDYFNNKYKIIDFAAKWLENSEEYKATLGNRCPAPLDINTKSKIEEVAKKTYNLVGCRDYARVDIRLSNGGEPFVLEVNANCAIGMGDGAVRSAKAAGYSYTQFLQKILDCALSRFHQ